MQLPNRIPQTDATDPRSYPAAYQPSPSNGSFAPNTGVPTSTSSNPYSAPFGNLPPGSSVTPLGPNGQPISPPFDPTTTPYGGAPAITRTPPNFGGAPYGTNPYGAPGPYSGGPYGPSPYGGPAPGFGGPSTPYYTPSGPDSLYPNGFGNWQGPNWNMPQYSDFQRLIQRVRMSHAWIGGGESVRDVGLNVTEVSATFDVPLFNLPDHFLITPGFGLNLWDGPVHTGPGSPDLPGQTYDAYLDVGWNPRITNWFSAEVGARVGVYTDFDTFSTDSIRVMGRGLGVVNLSPTLQAKLGVVYIDRNDIKLLPAGGLIWDPSPDRHWEIFFPRPKLAQRLSTVGNHNLWLYVAGEYGGGAWTIVRDQGFVDSFDYNDFRAMLGLEWIPESKTGPSGFIEVGYVFNRELVYVSLQPDRYDLPDTFIVRGGFSF